MATKEEHAAWALALMKIAQENLADPPDLIRMIIDGETAWTALIQATQAAQHAVHPQRHQHPQSRNSILDAIGRSGTNRTTQEDLAQIAVTAANTLHNHHYRPHLIKPGEHRQAISECQTLVNHLTQPRQ